MRRTLKRLATSLPMHTLESIQRQHLALRRELPYLRERYGARDPRRLEAAPSVHAAELCAAETRPGWFAEPS